MFGRLFKIQFKMRSKRAYTMILIQFVVALACTIFIFVRFSNWHFYLTNDTSSFFPEILTIFLFFAFFIGFYYYLFTIIQNERDNRNQSFRLIPLSDSKYYLNNILSSFAALVYFVFLEIVCLALLSGISYLLNNDFRQNTINTLNQLITTLPKLNFEFYLTYANLFFILILFCFYIYFIVSFLNFTSRTIMNFLPGTSNRIVLGIIRIIVILLIAWLISRAFNFLGTIISSNGPFFSGNGIGKSTISDLAIANIWLFVIDMVFLAADLFLFEKFFEPRER